MRNLFLAIGLVVSAAPALAGEPQMRPAWVDLMRDDLRDQRRDLTEAAMGLTGDKMVAFRAIYADYETGMADLGDRRSDQIMSYAHAYPDVTDELASELTAESLDIQKDMITLRKKTCKSIEKELGASFAARFLQIDMQIQDMIDLQLASQIPLVQPMDKPTAPGAEGDPLGKPVTPHE